MLFLIYMTIFVINTQKFLNQKKCGASTIITDKINMRKSIIILIAFLTFAIIANAHRVAKNGTKGGYMSCFAIGRSDVYTGTHSGDVFKSSANGAGRSVINYRNASYSSNTFLGNGSETGIVNYEVCSGTGYSLNNMGLIHENSYNYALYKQNSGTQCNAIPAMTGNTITSGTYPCPSLNYFAAKAISIAGTYNDIGSDGMVITTSDFDDANSAPQNIGFSFDYNCHTFDQFILNTNGFIKLGNIPPSTAALFFDGAQTSGNGIFNSADTADINLIAAFNHDLMAGTATPEYRVYTSGTAPYRVCTIQFKNVRDKTATPAQQYDNMQFQIKLYETSNIIEFVYGDWTPSANASAYKTSACGLKGSSNSDNQLLAVNKGSAQAWSAVTFSNANYWTTATLNFGNPPDRPKPDAGRTFRFIPVYDIDLVVGDIFALGEASLYHSNPQKIGVNIKNSGYNDLTNIPVTLNISGANTFADTQYISGLNSGESAVVYFSDFSAVSNGSTIITVSLPDDDYNADNTKSWSQNTNDNMCNYSSAAAAISGYGFTQGYQGVLYAKYHVSGSAKINSVKAFIYNYASNIGNTVYCLVLNSSGAIVGQSDNFLIQSDSMGMWHTFPIQTPPTVTDDYYYVGLAVPSGIATYYPMGLQNENPSRPDAYFYSAIDGSGLTQLDPGTFPYRFMVGSVLSPVSCAGLNYPAVRAQSVAGTYVDLGSNGAIIPTANFDDANSSAQDIGFSFNYNCQTFNQFILNTNGFIKLGNTPPSSAALFFDGAQTYGNGVFNSTDSADVNLIAVFNHDLMAGTGTPEYRLYTIGTAPYRVCTIQFKNVRDKTTAPAQQYDNMQFQIILYETSNIIEFVYGYWTPSANASAYKTSACGLKGSGSADNQLLVVNKGSGWAWNAVNFSNSNYVTTSTLNFGNPPDRPKPDAGRTFRFVPVYNNDLTVREIYTMGEASLYYSNPQKISVNIKNSGNNNMINIPVALNIFGANTFTDVQYISSLNPGDSADIYFSDFFAYTNGSTYISVSLPNDDYSGDNSKTWTQNTNDYTCNYSSADPATNGYGYAQGYSGIFYAKYYVNGSAKINSVKAFIYNYAANAGNAVQCVVLNSSGGLIGQSDYYNIQSDSMGMWHTFPIQTPPAVTDDYIYVGLAIPSGMTAYYPMGVQNENPSRTDAYYYSAFDGSGLTPCDPAIFPFRFMLGVVFSPASCTQLDYLASRAQSVPGTYVDLGSNGTIITTANFDDDNSAAQDIGFPFEYNCQTFTQFILNTNGFIKLGNTPPSAAALFFDGAQTAGNGIFNSTDPADVDLIAAFNHDLMAGTGTPEYRVYTSGIAPYRVCTIQFKNVRDKTVSPLQQYDNMQFQIRLYETTRIIEFVYGDWTPSVNASAYKTSACGLKGSSSSDNQLLVVNKGSAQAWSAVTFSNANYWTTATLNFGNPPDRPKPDAGRTFRFIPLYDNDLLVSEIYAMGEASLFHSNPQTISVNIKNSGIIDLANIPVTLNISGANTFTDTQYISGLNSGDSISVSFSDFNAVSNGVTTITVTLPDDQCNDNNTKTWTQNTNDYICNYSSSETATNGYGYLQGDEGVFYAKYHVSGSTKINSVKAFIYNYASNIGNGVYCLVLNSSGTVVGQSDTYIIQSDSMGMWHTFPIQTPPTVTDDYYYVGLAVPSGNVTYYPMGLQNENPPRPDAYFYSAIDGSGLYPCDPSTFTFRFMIGAVLAPLPPVAGTAYSDTILCSGNHASIHLNGFYGSIHWQESADGVMNWTDVSGGGGSDSAIYITSDLSLTTYFRATVTQPPYPAVYSNVITVSVNITPLADAGADATYSGIPVQVGDTSSGPGTFSWAPAAGLSDPDIARPFASPATTTTYTLTVDNNGCTATDEITVTYGNSGHSVSGKTRYAARANVGTPAPNLPTYNSVIYNLDHVIVILKNYPSGSELARDTSDVLGNFQFINIPDGEYLLTYDKYTADTMQWGNDINVADLAMLKYFIGSDTILDPSRNFSAKYRKAIDIDNNLYINVADVARLKAKIGSPYNAGRNFPKGNWVALNKTFTVAGSDISLTLETICYGDYNASSTKYRDSLVNWSMTKSLPQNIISVSQDYITTAAPAYFEIPLRISTKMNDFSALGLELNYPDQDFKLVNAVMPGADKYAGLGKINPTLEEIMAGDDDLLVTDEDGVIRVVYATTEHFDVAANDEVIRLGFRSLQDMNPGTLEFTLSGTGVIADQYGEENEDAYLLMPKIMVQGNKTEAGFEFEGYPNPFTNEVALKYSIPESGNIKLMIYNSIGEVVKELVNESQAGGKHTVRYSPEGFPAGMYTFRLEFNGTESKCKVLKMIH